MQSAVEVRRIALHFIRLTVTAMFGSCVRESNEQQTMDRTGRWKRSRVTPPVHRSRRLRSWHTFLNVRPAFQTGDPAGKPDVQAILQHKIAEIFVVSDISHPSVHKFTIDVERSCSAIGSRKADFFQ